jgi:hypothetical protein
MNKKETALLLVALKNTCLGLCDNIKAPFRSSTTHKIAAREKIHKGAVRKCVSRFPPHTGTAAKKIFSPTAKRSLPKCLRIHTCAERIKFVGKNEFTFIFYISMQKLREYLFKFSLCVICLQTRK